MTCQSGPLKTGTGAHVPGGYRWGRTGQGAAAVDEDLLAEGMVYASFPVVGEQAVFAEDAFGYPFREVGAENLELVFLADALVPAAEKEAGIVDVVVEVVVGEEEVVNLGGEQSGLDQLVRCCGAAVEHEEFAAELQDMGAAEPGGRGGGSSRAEGVDFCHWLPRVRWIWWIPGDRIPSAAVSPVCPFLVGLANGPPIQWLPVLSCGADTAGIDRTIPSEAR